MMNGIAGLFTPMLAHMLALQAVALVCSPYLDSASMTALAALILCWPMYRQMKKEGPQTKWKSLHALWLLPILGAAGNLACTYLMEGAGVYDHFSNINQENLFASSLWIQVAGLGILVPITEELIFRGLILQRAEKKWGVSTGILLSAALFSAYHGNAVQMLYAFPMGLLLGWSFSRWGNVIAPIMLHGGANLCGIFMQLWCS